MFLFHLSFGALSRLLRISKIFCFFALIMGALIWYRGKAGLMYIAVWESQRPSPLALQKSICFLQCYVCATWLCEAGACPKQQCYSGWVAPIVMTRAQSAKKHKKSDILTGWRVTPKSKRNRNVNSCTLKDHALQSQKDRYELQEVCRKGTFFIFVPHYYFSMGRGGLLTCKFGHCLCAIMWIAVNVRAF